MWPVRRRRRVPPSRPGCAAAAACVPSPPTVPAAARLVRPDRRGRVLAPSSGHRVAVSREGQLCRAQARRAAHTGGHQVQQGRLRRWPRQEVREKSAGTADGVRGGQEKRRRQRRELRRRVREQSA